MTSSCGPVAARKSRSPDRPISLPVFKGHMGSKVIRASRAGIWRAVVLIAVHLAIAIHIIQWLVSGMSDGERSTLSPVEPSESMFTLELGKINAGFIFFSAAILSTILFGRFFCGWGCHIVALQDLCAWLMRKMGIHPKPWRSRLLTWVPIALGTYMFIWPTFRREALVPLLELWLGPGNAPTWIGIPVPLHGFTREYFVEDFWATFAPPHVAIPYLIVVGFATVYFLGSKGFCTYGCPYGGIFSPVDRLAPVRIRVTDACHQCGHCTAVCTSNVRVAEEVRDFGMVVDPGCFKCLDCVSVCPNDALYVGLGKPAILAKARSPEAERRAHQTQRAARYHLSLAEELACGLVFLVLFRGFRGMPFLGDAIPMLMAVGIAGVGTFMVFKTWRLCRDTAVRGPRMALKREGRITLAGYAFALATLALCTLGGQGTALWIVMTAGDQASQRLERLTVGEGLAKRPALTHEIVYSPAYAPTPEARALAQQAIAWYERAAPWWRGGVGLYRPWEAAARLGWLKAVAGDRAGSEAALHETLTLRPPTDDLAIGLARAIRLTAGLGKGPAGENIFADDPGTRSAVDAVLRAQLARRPTLYGTRYNLASMLAARGQPSDAGALYQDALKSDPGDVRFARDAALVFMNLQQPAKAADALRAGLAARPRSGALMADLASVLFASGKVDEGRLYADSALRYPPTEGTAIARLAEVLLAVSRQADALRLYADAAARHPHDPGIIRDAVVVHLQAGKADAALSLLATGSKANPASFGLRAEYAFLLTQNGQLDAGLAEARQVLAAHPGPWARDVLEVLAAVFHAAGKPDEARPLDEAVRALTP